MELVLLAVLAAGMGMLVGMVWMLHGDLQRLRKRIEELAVKEPDLLEANGNGPQWMQEWLYGGGEDQ